jgi:hypothetical protein
MASESAGSVSGSPAWDGRVLRWRARSVGRRSRKSDRGLGVCGKRSLVSMFRWLPPS